MGSSSIGLASVSEAVWQGAWPLVAYRAGLGLPFLLTAPAFGGPVRAPRRLQPAMPLINRVGAVFVIGVGVLMRTNTFARLAGLFNWVGRAVDRRVIHSSRAFRVEPSRTELRRAR